MPSVCASEGRRIAPRPNRRHGAAGGDSATKSGRFSRRPGVDLERLFLRQRAHRVDEATPGPHRVRSRDEQLPLERGEVAHVVGLHPPARVGSAPQHSEPAAGRIEQHAVERAFPHGGMATVGHDRGDHAVDADAFCGPRHRADPTGMQVGGDDKARRRASAPPPRSPFPRARRRCRARGRRAADRAPRRWPGSPGPAASPGRRRWRARPRSRRCGAPTGIRARAFRARPRRPRPRARPTPPPVWCASTLTRKVTGGASLSSSRVAMAAAWPNAV